MLLATKREICTIGGQQFIREALTRGAFAVNPEYTAVTSDLVSMAHQVRLNVNAFTVNGAKTYGQLAALNVDNVFCDNPHFIAR